MNSVLPCSVIVVLLLRKNVPIVRSVPERAHRSPFPSAPADTPSEQRALEIDKLTTGVLH
jgi:hypothetical protein